MTVITISRELGSRGDDVAVEVARRLGLRLVGRELINKAAADAGAGEVALAELDELGLLGLRPSNESLQRYREKVIQVIEAQAAAGDVLIVGRGAQVVLAAAPEVLHLRITAPVEWRCQIVQARCNVDAGAARARVEASDAARAAYHKRHFGVNWQDEALYDLIVNMVRLRVPAAVESICAAALALRSEEEGERS